MIKKLDKILFKGGQALDLTTGKMKQVDFSVANGKIDKISSIDPSGFKGETIDITGSIIVPGLIDIHVHLREPGNEAEETIETGCAAAMAGGFTEICCMPDTEPACDRAQTVRYIKEKAQNELVNVLPIAAITKKRGGAEITEMADLIHAGAIAFSDDESPLSNSSVMRKALEYAGMFKAPIIDHCEDVHLTAGGQINESIMSTRLGLSPMPNAAEAIIVARDIALAQLTGEHVHLTKISAHESVDLIRKAKKQGIKITCDTVIYNLFLTDEEMTTFNTNLKLNPPLRRPVDVKALLEGLLDGTIDAIVSDHSPHSIENKDVEFAVAPFGIIGLETTLGLLITHLVNKNKLPLEKALSLLSLSPRKALNLEMPEFKEGAIANLTIFNPEKTFTPEKARSHSVSWNTPFFGQELHGAVTLVMNRGKFWSNVL